MTSSFRFGACPSSSASPGAASSNCSRLSRTSRSCFSRRYCSSVCGSLTFSVRATVGSTRSGSRRAASETNQTPSRNSSASSKAACCASRVLPMPPGPVSVSNRFSRSSFSTSASSRSRPTSGVACAGRFEGAMVGSSRAGSLRRMARSSARSSSPGSIPSSSTSRRCVCRYSSSASPARPER